MFQSHRGPAFALLGLALSCPLSLARDAPGGYMPLEPSLRSTYPWNVTDDEIRNLPLDAPLLREMYATISGAHERMIRTNPDYKPLIPVLDDLKRRGNEATPLLLDIMEHNHNTDVEYMLPRTAAGTGTIDMEPYLKYLRKAMRTRPHEINANAANVTTRLFFMFGTAEDIELMRWLAGVRPYLKSPIERELAVMEEYAARKKGNPPPEAAQSRDAAVDKDTRTLEAADPTTPTHTRLLGWAAAGLALAGLVALALRRRAGAGADR